MDPGETPEKVTRASPAAAAGSLCRVPPWLAALFVAGPILVAEFPGAPVLVVIPLTLAGAYAGTLVRCRTMRS